MFNVKSKFLLIKIMLIVVNLRFINYKHGDWSRHLNNFMTFWGTLLHFIDSTVNAVFYR